MNPIDEAINELKRADHIIYVSLKYTRTADILKGALLRIMNAFNFGTEHLLEKLVEENKILEIPPQPGKRATLIKEYYEDDELKDYLNFYRILRLIDKEEYSKGNEFRRHVWFAVNLPEGEIEINIDIITGYFHKTKEFVEYITKLTKKPEND